MSSPKPFVFVLMPFDATFDDVYKLGIRAACSDAGAYCERVDEQIFHESILDRVYNQIAKADLLIADMTGRNPNVFYEVGYAHALGRRVILLTQNADDIPFDLKHYPHIVYGSSISKLKDELVKRARWAVEHPEVPLTDAEPQLELFVGPNRVESGVDFPLRLFGSRAYASVQLYNPSDRVIEGADFHIALDTPAFITPREPLHKVVRLPDGNLRHLLPTVREIFPGAWDATEISRLVRAPGHAMLTQVGVPATLTVVSRIGVREYQMMLKKVLDTKTNPEEDTSTREN